ncbi:MAG: histidine phosphatase family protein [Candidatus Adiutrix sp.]|nr:histidine phosphatase family protein [Candidatus Adiutrix sp.]
MKTVKPLRLFFIRHGQTEHFDRPPFNGWRDAQLTDFGRSQLDQVAAGLAPVPFDAVYSSDLSRARYGGEQLAKATGLTLRQSPQWREISFGRWEGLTYPQIVEQDGDLINRIFSFEGAPVPFPEGESYDMFADRIRGAFAELRAQHPDGGRVALVAHSGVCKTLWGLLLNIPPHVAWRTVHQDFAAVNVADIYPELCVAHLVNGYLGPEGYHAAGPGFERLAGDKIFKAE